ncbi:unnamed protein product [Moneuplotes crassus]|uniref:RING-type domain-containing protein n=1 Tax=Euplotes crassus TaxID=5936 RepID=A0AAD1XV24_EUPCR|nr:unnamed protein product [Moneuplotes crassus]
MIAFIGGIVSEDSIEFMILLSLPELQIFYLIVHGIYYCFKKCCGAALYYGYIPTGYLLVISVFVNIMMIDEYAGDQEDEDFFCIVQCVSILASIVFLVLLFVECCGNRDQSLDLGDRVEVKDKFDQIPSIIFQAFTPLKSDECAICLTKYEQDDTIKVLPGCFHTFHAECIKEWFENNPTCPFCRREFTLDDIQRCEGMSEDEIYRCIQASDVRPSLFNGPQRMDPRDSLNTPYNPNYKG